jgi:3-hydroxyisobutyrate dehydrogenase
MAKIAFLGLGAMGARMASHLIAAGHELIVWNRNAAKATALVQKGARSASSPRQAAQGAEIVFAMLRDDAASRHVWLDKEDGALTAMTSQAMAIECSTLGLDWVRELARHCQAREIAFLDAPVSGSRPQAEAKQLIFIVGGDPEHHRKAEPVLLAMGAAAHHVGPVGAGMTLKLALNVLLGIQVATMGELIETLRRQQVDPARAVEINGATAVASPALKVAAQMMLANSFAPLFPVELMAKDLGYALAAAGSESRGPMTAAAKAVFEHGTSQGLASDHMAAIVQLYR